MVQRTWLGTISMEPKTSIQGIIFDMDGVLCDSEPFICEAAGRMFAERHALTVKPDDFRPFVGTGEDRFLGGVAEKYGIALAMPADKDRTYAIYLDIIRGRLHTLPGARDFVADCRRRGLKLAIATSADRVKLDGNPEKSMLDSRFRGNDSIEVHNLPTRLRPYKLGNIVIAKDDKH